MAKAMTATPTEGRNRTMIVVAVVFAAIAAVLLFVALQSGDGGGSGGGPLLNTDVVVATEDISANTILTADMLEVKSVAADQALAGAFAEPDLVVGQAVRYPIQAGEQVTTARVGLQAVANEEDLAYVLEPGMRAVSVEVSEITSVGGLLLPGNFVDLIVVVDGGQEGLADNRALTILENVEVLAVAQEAQQPVPAASTSAGEGDTDGGAGVSGQRSEDVERQPRARSVTVAATPEQAQLIAFIQAEGDARNDLYITLALRAAGDTGPGAGEAFFPPSELAPPVQP